MIDDAERTPSVRDVIAADGDRTPDYLFAAAPYDGTRHAYEKARFFAPEWHAAEVRHVWKKAWQMACRMEEIPEPGDFLVYDIANLSFLVVHGEDGVVRAFHNSCSHRGSQLAASGSAGTVAEFRCPYHGWRYGLDGAVRHVPSAWDFPQLKGCPPGLAEVRAALWGGFVFLTMDAEAPPLITWLGALAEHVPDDFFARRRIGAHVAKVIDCNWKVGIEAFLEGYHVAEVHPQALPFTGDTNGQLDVWAPHVSRMIANVGLPSPRMPADPGGERTIEALRGFLAGDTGELPAGAREAPRKAMADAIGAMLTTATGVDHAHLSTAEIIDAINYHVFPNWMPWTGFGTPIVYRLRPHGNDPDRSILEVWLLYAVPDETRREPPAATRWLAPGEPWSAAPELGGLGPIFDQDECNFAMIQRGLKAGGRATINLADYQESRIRFFHDTLDRYVGRVS